MISWTYRALVRRRLNWRLRWAAENDFDGLHAVTCQPLVYRHLFDGMPPTRESILDKVKKGMVDSDCVGVGLHVTEANDAGFGGCVQLEPDQPSRSAELSYFLDLACWGQGSATRMAWTAITLASDTPHIDCIFVGADRPNQASIAIMHRLGMSFRRDVKYPLEPGVEYVICRDDPAPSNVPALLSVSR
ncbi:MAG: GNAT family N-acetyltransferase [Geminicoccaceae bacterium]